MQAPITRLIAALLLLHATGASAASAPRSCERSWTLQAEHPHAPSHFTQGLVLHAGRLFESVGLYGRSGIHEVDVRSGRALRTRPLPADEFGEGLAVVGATLVQLTWREGKAHVYDLDLRHLRTHRYPGEGWGLSRWDSPAGPRLILSDGTPVLRLMDVERFEERARVTVRENGRAVRLINELEVVGDELLANVWHQDRVLAIDPGDGVVRGWFDFSALRQRLRWPGRMPAETDLNGLAYDPVRQRLLVTGKQWPALFEVSLGSCASQ